MPLVGTDTNRLFQLGYVTLDIESAVDRFLDEYGVEDFLRLDTTPPDGPPGMKIALAFHGGTMLEIINPPAGGEWLYADALRPDGGVSLHHLGYLVDEPTGIEGLHERFDAAGTTVSMRFTFFGLMGFYADTRADLGHYSEFVYCSDVGRRFLTQIPGV